MYGPVAGMAWRRPDPADTQGGPLWSAAPGAQGTTWGALDPGKRQGDSFFVQRLQEYGGLEAQRLLDLDWTRMVHTVTSLIFTGSTHGEPPLTGRVPISPIGYGEAKDYVLRQYGRLPEGRGEEGFGSFLADYINTEISARAETCHDDVHYKAIENGQWYILGGYVEPPPWHVPLPSSGQRRGAEPGGQRL